jgi:hypothetical protein
MSQLIIQLLTNCLNNILQVHDRIHNCKFYVKCCLLWLLPPPWPQPVRYEVVLSKATARGNDFYMPPTITVGGEKEICISLLQNENPIHWLPTSYMTFEQQNPQHTLNYKAHHITGTSQSWIHPWCTYMWVGGGGGVQFWSTHSQALH